jgi:hypothetical protein
MRHDRLRQSSGVMSESEQSAVQPSRDARRLLAMIPMRYRIVIGVFVFTLGLWLISLGHFNHYFKSTGTQIVLTNGTLLLAVPRPSVVFRYEMVRPLLTSVGLAVCVVLYPLLRTTGGAICLAVLLNFLTCGLEFGNPLSALCVPVFDIALFMCGLEVLAQRGRKPPPAGICVKCGYDLRATPERCPECGTPVWRMTKPLPDLQPNRPKWL